MDKICKMCGECKDITLYQKNRQAKDGYSKMCKECMMEYRARLKSMIRDFSPRMSAVSKKDYCGMYEFLTKLGYDVHGDVHQQFCDKHGLKPKKRQTKQQNAYKASDCL